MVFKGERNRASPVFPLYGTDDRNFRATPRQYSSITQPTRPARNHGRSNDEAWRTWKEVSVKIHDIPAETTTKDLYLCFSKEGTLISIDLHENARGEREGRATIKFWYGIHNPSYPETQDTECIQPPSIQSFLGEGAISSAHCQPRSGQYETNSRILQTPLSPSKSNECV